MMARFASSASHPRDREASRRQGTSPCVGPRAELARRTTAAGKVRHGGRARPCMHACSQRIEWYAEKRVGGALAPRLARCECEKCNFPFPHTTPSPIITETGLHARRLIRSTGRVMFMLPSDRSRMHAAQAPLELGYTPHMRHTPPAAHGTSSGVSLDVTRRRKEHCH
jgi:hypothetical protein